MAPDLSKLPARIEAFLFSEGGTLTVKKLAQLLDVKPDDLKKGIAELERQLQGRGLTLIHTDSEVTLALSKETSAEVKVAFERELGREIGDAGLEVIAIILYAGHSTRARIDYIRGVNTSSTIRTLLSRGLLERVGNPDDAREYLYRPTVELLAHLGVRTSSELPDYDKIANELKHFESAESPFTDNPPTHGESSDSAHDGAASTG